MQRRMWREGHRRSPRISALDVNKKPRLLNPVTTTCGGITVNLNKPPRQWGKRRGSVENSKKKKLIPLQDVSSPPTSSSQDSSSNEQDLDDRKTSPEEPPIFLTNSGEKYNDRVTNPGQHHMMPFVSSMPDRRILEFILDVLQRRDTHEIFAQPVDPDEVEDYYEIVEQPMDFGTMRAKLHEGMYRSLEQFEHDVFLISRNAMHFNSSRTIYFRQARAIDELAKKIFHVLKTDPENFVTEFSGTRRWTNKKTKVEARGSTHGSSSKLATSSRSSSVTAYISRKSMPNSSNSKLNSRTTTRVIPGYSGSGISIQFGMVDDEVHFGSGIGDSSSLEADRRCSYKPWLSVLSENYSVVSPKLLMLNVDQQGVGYSESLMRFAKDLGPTAQMIAKRKLNGLFREANTYMNSGSINRYGIPQQTSSMIYKAASVKMSENIHMGQRLDMCEDDNEAERAYSHGVCFEPVGHGSNRVWFGADRYGVAGGIFRSNNFQENEKDIRVGGLNMEDGSRGFSTQYLRGGGASVGHGADWRLKSGSGSGSDFIFGVPLLKTRVDEIGFLGT